MVKTATPSGSSLADYALELGIKAREASRFLRGLSDADRSAILKRLIRLLQSETAALLEANAKDVEAASDAGLSVAMIDRLRLDKDRLKAIVENVKAIAAMPDPLARELETKTRPDGLIIKRVSVPIGTVLFIYESRPNVTIDAAALCIKSGNAVILRGGKEAVHSNQAFGVLVAKSLAQSGVDAHCVQLVKRADRELVDFLVQDHRHLDLVIPRGGEKLIQTVVEKSRVPVIKHYKGVCHIYVDKTADPATASAVVHNAKVQRPGVCNAMETLLIDKGYKPELATAMLQDLVASKVTLVGDAGARALHPKVAPAEAGDWDEEYLELKLAVKVVDGVKEAIAHINKHGTGHTDAILAKAPGAIKQFVDNIDSSSVMINASTRFADGGEYGLGAEVGISTDKLHARGPMGLESLTTYKWIVEGKGHIRG